MEETSSRAPLPSRSSIFSDRDVWRKEKGERDRRRFGFDSKYWCVNGKVYDLMPFLGSHPGGREWLELTRGQDISELYETHHLNETLTNAILKKYYVYDAKHPKAEQIYTFQRDGFYKKLKQKIAKIVIPDAKSARSSTGPTLTMQVACLSVVLSFLVAFVWLLCGPSLFRAVLCGLLLHGLTGVGHNFLHQRPSIWRYCLDFTCFSHYEWMVSHVISHHCFPNTELDFEMEAFEPMIFSMVNKPRNHYLANIYLHILGASINVWELAMRVFKLMTGSQKFRWENLIVFMELALLIAFCGFGHGICYFLIMHAVCSYLVMVVSFPVHRSSYTWTEGCPEASKDFGEHTLKSTQDYNVDWGLIPSLLFFELFNNHVLHHLFPCLDESRLDSRMQEAFLDVCKEFGHTYRMYRFTDLFFGVLENVYRWPRIKKTKDV